MKKTALLASVLAGCLFLAGCGASGLSVQEGASQHETLVIYTPHREEIYQPIIKEFEERTGIWVTVVTGGSNQLFERVAQEENAPQCDVVFGGSAEVHDAYMKWIEPYAATGMENIDAAFCSPQNIWTPFSLLPIVIVYNTKIVPKAQAPTGWASLLLPQWKGRIAFADPVVSASCHTSLAAMAQSFPGQEWSTLAAFAENLDGQVLQSSGQITTAVVDGKYAVGVSLEEAAHRAKQSGKEIDFIYPEEGTCAIPDATSLVKNAPNPENGRLFIDFTISRDLQHMVTSQFARRSVFEGAEPPQGLPSLEDVPLMAYDYEWSVANYQELLNRWQREF